MRNTHPSGQTTARVYSTNEGTSARRRSAISWVFPEWSQSATRLTGQRTLFGRGDDCDVQLSGNEASRYHAELLREGPLLTLHDLQSTNGTFVDGARIERAPLTRGSVIRLGGAVGVIVSLSAADQPEVEGFREIVAGVFGGPSLVAALEPIRRGAQSDLSVVVYGETGTGKECAARALHAWSGRRGPFLALNCAALPENLAEAELFGCEKGAYTGAASARPGYFRSADGGTLLLDEIIDLPLSVQAKLLRVLEQREVTPLGASKPIAVDVRVVAAAQEPLAEAVSQKRFRGDLYARLAGLEVRLPPLRERVEDVPPLFDRFLRAASGGRPPATEARLVESLCLHDYPFNVRELQLVAKRLLVMHGHEPVLRRGHLPEELRRVSIAPPPAAPSGPPESASRDSASASASDVPPSAERNRDERDLAALIQALREHRGHVTRAAAALGFSRQRAYRLMQARPDIDLEALRQGYANERKAT